MKAVGRNSLGEIENKHFSDMAMAELNFIFCEFTGQKFDFLNPIIS